MCRAPRRGQCLFESQSDLDREGGESRDRRFLGRRSAASPAPLTARASAPARRGCSPQLRQRHSAGTPCLSLPQPGLKDKYNPSSDLPRIIMKRHFEGWLHAEGWHAPRFDPTQYVREQRERRRLMAARLHQGLPAADTSSRSTPRARSMCSVRSGEGLKLASSAYKFKVPKKRHFPVTTSLAWVWRDRASPCSGTECQVSEAAVRSQAVCILRHLHVDPMSKHCAWTQCAPAQVLCAVLLLCWNSNPR